MTVDPSVIPGLLILAAELLALATAGYIVARVGLRQADDRLALAHGLLIGPALWGLLANFLLHLFPGMVGALSAWFVVIVLSAGLVWRTKARVMPRLRTAVTLATAGSAVYFVALAARQLWGITEPHTHLGLAARVHYGGWPLVFPWTPDQPFIYHYGIDLLVGLLTPQNGPTLAFTIELLDAYIWTSYALVVVVTLMSRTGWISLLVLAPIIFTAGAWTMLIESRQLDILSIPIPTGIPAAGVRASLASIYWPEVSLDWQAASQLSPPNIWKPAFVMSYTLALVVLTYALASRHRSWLQTATVAATVGFIGLLSEDIALVVLFLWAGAEVFGFAMRSPSTSRETSFMRQLRRLVSRGNVSKDRPGSIPEVRRRLDFSYRSIGSNAYDFVKSSAVLRGLSGPAIAIILLALGGGPISALITGSDSSGISLGWLEDPNSRQPLGSLITSLPGGIGILGLGVFPVAIVALVIRVRQRLTLALTVGSMAFLFVSLTLNYEPAPYDLFRIDGHARNFALLAFLLAVAIWLGNLRASWRYATGILIFALITWPSAAGPIRMLALEVSQGIELSNAGTELDGSSPTENRDASSLNIGRYSPPKAMSDVVRDHIRNQTPIDSRILSPKWTLITPGTGRLNASGFIRYSHVASASGPDYLDAISFLEPIALKRMGATHVHATEAWLAMLPDRAQRWLDDPQLFELLVRGEADRLYRVLPAFIRLNPAPDPRSFEALRLTIPASSAVRVIGLTSEDSLRIASTLGHTRLLGTFPRGDIHLRTAIISYPAHSAPADFVVIARDRPSPYGLRSVRPIWWNRSAIAYATTPSSIPAIDPPPQPDSQFIVRVSEIRQTDDRVSFSATFSDRASTAWTGQDWLLISGRDLPWALPTEDNGITVASLAWFAGQIAPGGESTHVYEFDARQNQLAVQDHDGAFAAIQSSGERLAPGLYVLAVRLRYDHLQAAIIPVMRIAIPDSGQSDYTLYAGEHATQIMPCPERLNYTRSCVRVTLESQRRK